MKRLNLAILLFTTILIGGCAANGPLFKPSNVATAENGTLYIYRANKLANGGRKARVIMNGERMPNLKNNGYQTYDLAPGTYKIIVHDKSTKLEIKPGKESYLRFRIGWKLFNAVTMAPSSLKEVTKDFAMPELANTKLSQEQL